MTTTKIHIQKAISKYMHASTIWVYIDKSNRVWRKAVSCDRIMQLLWYSHFMTSPKKPAQGRKHIPRLLSNRVSCVIFSVINSSPPHVNRSGCLSFCWLQISWLQILSQSMCNNAFCLKSNSSFWYTMYPLTMDKKV